MAMICSSVGLKNLVSNLLEMLHLTITRQTIRIHKNSYANAVPT